MQQTVRSVGSVAACGIEQRKVVDSSKYLSIVSSTSFRFPYSFLHHNQRSCRFNFPHRIPSRPDIALVACPKCSIQQPCRQYRKAARMQRYESKLKEDARLASTTPAQTATPAPVPITSTPAPVTAQAPTPAPLPVPVTSTSNSSTSTSSCSIKGSTLSTPSNLTWREHRRSYCARFILAIFASHARPSC
jgi:hypothetical protein